MKTSSLIILFLFLFATGSMAQVTLDCESGNRAVEQGNCWGFGATSYSNTANLVIGGLWSTKSNSLTNNSPTACWIKTPWMLMGNGNITFQTRLDGAGNGVISKGISLWYIPYVASASYGEGTPVEFYTYAFPAYNVTTIRDISVAIPPVIQNSSTPYKIRVSYIGQGGNERAYSDNFIFPGTYWSDPANGCTPLIIIQDTDSDGVTDANDAYPTDPFRAYNSFSPSASQYGTLAFEDSWPSKADYDFNDLVVDYKTKIVTNASNKVVEVFNSIITRASGAGFHNGFGFQLDGIAPDKIINVTGYSVSPGSIFNVGSNGLENGQSNSTCIVFDDFFNVMPHPGAGTGINTDMSAPMVPYDTLNIHMVFINNGTPAPGGTVSSTQLTAATFNYFIVSNQERGREIHLPDRVPTSLANTALFGTQNDDSNPGSGKYYKTENNLPWAMNIVQGFAYPSEKNAINDAYNYFIEWAGTSGSSYPNWHQDLPGYRDQTKVY